MICEECINGNHEMCSNYETPNAEEKCECSWK